MARADQLKALLKAYSEGDDLHFYSVAMHNTFAIQQADSQQIFSQLAC
jgi:hypothetical protein